MLIEFQKIIWKIPKKKNLKSIVPDMSSITQRSLFYDNVSMDELFT